METIHIFHDDIVIKNRVSIVMLLILEPKTTSFSIMTRVLKRYTESPTLNPRFISDSQHLIFVDLKTLNYISICDQ